MRLEYFTATWCGPCRIFGPIVSKVTALLDVPTEKLDIEKDGARVPSDIMSIPVVIMYQDDKEVSRIIGQRNEQEFKDWILSGGI